MKNLKINAFGDVVERGLYDYGTHKNQLNLFDEDWYEEYCDCLTVYRLYPDLKRFGDLEEKVNRTCKEENLEKWLDIDNPLDYDSILDALILIGN